MKFISIDGCCVSSRPHSPSQRNERLNTWANIFRN